MKVLVTGAAGFIGRAVVTELVQNNHEVLALVRSDANAEIVRKLGAKDLRGDIEDTAALKSAASSVDGVIHLAFTMDFSNFVRSCAIDRAAITALAEGMRGTGKPLIMTSGTLGMPSAEGGEVATEDTEPARTGALAARIESEDLIKVLSKEMQVRGCVMRLSPLVHGPEDKGFVPMLAGMAQKSGKVVYIGEGNARWPSVHRRDAAVLYRLVLEKGTAGSMYHGIAEQGVKTKDIADAIAGKFGLPAVSISQEEAGQTMGFFAGILGHDNATSSAKTQAELGWKPKEGELLADIKSNYFK